MDQSKKTMRHFYCRDVLWETFEQMANDFDCSIDYLINEAMRYYARSKNYQSAMATSGPVPPQPMMGAAPGGGGGGGGFGPNGPGGYGAAPTTQPPLGGPHVARRTNAPPPPPANAPVRRQGPSQAPPVRASSPGPYAGPSGGPGPSPMAMPGAATLYLIYNNQRFPITKDQFIIGRGSKTSDLPIKDGNISRKHAAVIRRNGTYYIKDLGSTNGIDYKGMRIDNKRIDEGDVFHLCDYELRFTYRGD
ncbi:MAG TPA: FHA domain-containing protein [Kofleriaceae bacterium]|jgi:pSer/pThr/pTyr-binding forkhead associated (FHA) protein